MGELMQYSKEWKLEMKKLPKETIIEIASVIGIQKQQEINVLKEQLNNNWQIELVDRYFFASGRNAWTYVENTFLFNPNTLERKEIIRQHGTFSGQEYSLPTWAKSITQRRKNLESDRIY